MEKVADYFLVEKVAETRNSIVYSGKKANESGTVIIKILKSHLPTPSEIARFKQEYNLVKSLDIDGIVKVLDIVVCGNSYAIIEEDFNGIALRKFLKTTAFNLSSFLQIAVKLAEILGILHWNHVIHLDIKPDNILINQKEGRIKITDFGISTVLTHAYDEIYNPDVITGTLSYMSPEQTGRMNRSIDYRTDLYSLGITFYEMCTGLVPFRSIDPMEIIHSHMARIPQAPDEVNPALPKMVSKIILKLLAKTPEERYQNSMGLMADIGECIKQLDLTGGIGDFPLAAKDVSIRFNIPQIIVGREKEKEKLISAFEQAAGGTCGIMLVQGAPGIGKSSLVQEIHKSIAARRGYFIAGKYNQFGKDIPYNAFIQAFQGFVKQLLTENEERITAWKEQLLGALGPNGKVITGVIPELELIIGKQPEIPELGPQETQNRFKLVFLDFIRIFAAREHPLALFLDDLQWADLASLNLLKAILTDKEMKFLFLTGTCRNDEMTPDQPLAITLDEIRKEGRLINCITLKPLQISGINSIIMEVIRCEAEKSMPMAALIYEKTAGNPFFVIQFLKKLYDNRIIELHPRLGWQWDVDRIKDLQVTDNVVEFLAEKIINLPQNIQDLLKTAACIGSLFDLETMSAISGKSFDEVLSDLAVAIRENLVSAEGDLYKFNHDRIQEAAYFLLAENEKAQMHYRIGSNALKKTAETVLPEKVFFIVDQLNRGIALVKSNGGNILLAALNLRAGEKAMISTAYASALSYLKTGIELLPENAWERDYPLTYSLYRNRMECEYLTRHFEEAASIFQEIITKAKNKIDKIHAYSIIVGLYTYQGNIKEAISLGIEGLHILGKKFPDKVTTGVIAGKALQLYLQFGKRKIEDILTMPFAADQTILAYIDLLLQMSEAVYYYNTNLFSYIIIEATSIIVKYGLHKDAAVVFMGLAIIIGPVLGFYNQGYRLGVMALKLNERMENTKTITKTSFVFGSFLLHWKKHIKESIDLYRESYKRCYEVGNLFFAAHCINLLFTSRLIAGDNIDEIIREYTKYHDFLLTYKNNTAVMNYNENINMCFCFQGLTEKRGYLNSGDFNEDKQVQYYRSEMLELSCYFFSILRIKIRYLFGIFTDCIPLIKELYELDKKKIDVGSSQIAEAYFYASLAITALYNEAGAGEKALYKNILRHNRKKMKLWSALCPENYLHKELLMEAERARIRGKCEKAASLYAAAIKSAYENGYTQNEGIANERAALFMLELDDGKSAAAYMQAARHCYVLWGAADKVKQLDETHPDLLAGPVRAAQGSAAHTSGSDSAAANAFDLMTLIKTSQSLSSEIEIGKLLKHIMKLFIENAGAEHGYLILEKGEEKKLYIEAAGKIDDEADVLESVPLERNKTLAIAIVHYVYKTGENIVLNNAADDPRFVTDPYIAEHKPKSILCVPIRCKGALTGIIYLENNLATCAFTPGRIELLQVLSAQAAISIENSRLVMHRENAAKLETEMRLAREIQTVLLPATPVIRDYEITACMEPAEMVGGDYYDVINTENCGWIIIGDVSGHGMTAGLVMMMAQTTIHTILDQQPDITPSGLLVRVNKMITRNINLLGGGKYMTITALAVKDAGLVTFAGAHQDILVYRAKTAGVEEIATQGLWIGIQDDITGSLTDQSFVLERGDVMLLYTDGITEALPRSAFKNGQMTESMFGTEKLCAVFGALGMKTTGEILQGILEAIKRDYVQGDDFTLLAARRSACGG